MKKFALILTLAALLVPVSAVPVLADDEASPSIDTSTGSSDTSSSSYDVNSSSGTVVNEPPAPPAPPTPPSVYTPPNAVAAVRG